MILEWYSKICWANPSLDALVLRPPDHDGSPQAIARQVYHRLLVRLLCVRVYRAQWWCIAASAILTVLAHAIAQSLNVSQNIRRLVLEGDPSAKHVGAFSAMATFAVLIIFLPLIFSRFWLQIGPDTPEVNEARGVVERVFFRRVPVGTPTDLADVFRQHWITESGLPASSEISAEDASSTAGRNRVLWWIPSALVLAVPIGVLCGTVDLAGWIGTVFFLKLVFDKNPAKERAQELDEQHAVEGAAFVGAGGREWAAIANAARARQMEEAAKDSSGFIPLGVTTGVMSARGDLYSPSAGLPFGTSLRDLQSHLLVLGGTGSGKTSGVLRPIARRVGAWPRVGMVILDGKGALPAELSNIQGMRLIDPSQTRVSLIDGLTPVDIVNTLRDVMSKSEKSGQGSSRFWVDSASTLLRHAAVIADAAGQERYTLAEVGRIAAQADARSDAFFAVRKRAVALHPRAAAGNLTEEEEQHALLTFEAANPLLGQAIDFFQHEWSEMDPETRSNVLGFAQSWLSTIFGHADLLKWAETTPYQSQVRMEEALVGGRLALLVPAHRYGEAGALVTALLKARLYAGLKKRAGRAPQPNETPVLLIVDEAQSVATSEDADMLAIGRSLGLAMVAATQTVEGVVERLGNDVARKWLNIYGSVVVFPSRSPDTDSFVAERAGQTFQPTVEEVEGMTVRTAIRVQAVSGAISAARTQAGLREVIDRDGFSLERIYRSFASLFQRVTGLGGRRSPVSRLGLKPLLQAGELPNLLGEPNTALALTTRARVAFRDVIRVQPEYQ